MVNQDVEDVRLRRVTGTIRWPHLQPKIRSRVAYVYRERRRTASPSFDIAAALELHLKRYASKASMLTLLHSWLSAAEREDLVTTQPYYVHALRYAIDVLTELATPEAAISVLRETQENVHFIVTPAKALNVAGTATGTRFMFERKGRGWTWKCINGEQVVRTADRSFRSYLDCFQNASCSFAGFHAFPISAARAPYCTYRDLNARCSAINC